MNGGASHVSHPSLPPILIAAALLALAGCQRSEDRLADAAIARAAQAGTAAERGGGQGAVRTADGGASSRAGDSLPLPTDFPADVYLPGEYAVNSVMDLHGVSMVSLTARGEVSPLFKAARAGMEARGWTQTLAAQHSVDSAMLAFEKPAEGARRSATLSFNRSNGGGEVVVGVQLRKSQVR